MNKKTNIEDKGNTENYEDFYEYNETDKIQIKASENNGENKIYAWLELDGYVSKMTESEKIKIDTVKPTVNYTIEPTRDTVADKDGWYNDKVTVTITGEDKSKVTINGIETEIEGSKVAEYGYVRGTGNIAWQGNTIKIEKEDMAYEGAQTIQIQVKDLSGNESEIMPVEVKKDTQAPYFINPIEGNNNKIVISKETSNKMQITVKPKDDASGSVANTASDEFKNKKITCYGKVIQGSKEIPLNDIETSGDTTVTWNVEGLEPNTNTSIIINARDLAGNSTEDNGGTKTETTSIKTMSTLQKPNVGTVDDAWHKDPITISVSDNVPDGQRSSTDKIKWKLKDTSGNTVDSGEITKDASGKISGNITVDRNGEYTLKIWAEDADGNRSEVETRTTKMCKEHDYSTTVETPATCTSGGTNRLTCTRCGYSTTQSTSALGHSYPSSWTTYTSATCTSSGEQRRYCMRGCGSFMKQTLPALGHNYVPYYPNRVQWNWDK